jgi:phage protein D
MKRSWPAPGKVIAGLPATPRRHGGARGRITGWIGVARGSSASEEDAVSDLDKLEAAVSECREMIREAHAATKDLRAAVREARQEVRALAKDEVTAQVRLEVSRQLAELGERTGEAVTAATQKVIAEFDRFGESLLGKETYWQKASGRRSAARPETDVVPPDILPSEDKD